MKLVAVGSIAIDDIETAQESRKGLVGGSLTYFAYAASLYNPVHMVGIAGEDFPEEVFQELSQRGCVLEGVRVEKGRSFHWACRYDENLEDRQTLVTELNVFERFDPELPPSYRNCDILFLGNISPSLQEKVMSQTEVSGLVAMDTMNHWIEGQRQQLLEVIKKVDLIFVNQEEAELLTGVKGFFRACTSLISMGPRYVVLKRGESGAVLYSREAVAALPAYPLQHVVDPTGAGDSFAGAFLGYLAREGEISGRTMKKALARAIALASFTIEDFSVERLRKIKEEDVELRVEHLKGLVRFWD